MLKKIIRIDNMTTRYNRVGEGSCVLLLECGHFSAPRKQSQRIGVHAKCPVCRPDNQSCNVNTTSTPDGV